MRSSLVPPTLAAVFAVALGGCEADVTRGVVGGSIALVDARRLAVVDADAGSVSFVDADTLETLIRVDVGDEPRGLLVLGSRLYVAVRRSGELVEVATDEPPRVLRRVAVCTGPRALAATPEGELLVACEWDGRVRGVDPTTLDVRTHLEALSRPIAVAAAGEAIFALEAHGRLVRVAGGNEQWASLVPSADRDRPALTKMDAHDASALAIVDGGRSVAVAFELVNPSGDGNGEPVVDDYGSVTDGRPKINPALRRFSTQDLSERSGPSTYARYDAAQALRCNGPSALAVVDDAHVLVAHRSSADLALVALDAPSSDARLGEVHAVGAGAAGVAFDRAHGVAWTDDALAGTISRVTLGGDVTTRVRALPQTSSPMALQGRRTFFDSTNPHLSPAGVVACATCHPEGGEDGLVWFIRAPTIPAKRRVTPHLGNAGAATAPYHWDGGLPDRATLVRSTIVNLMAGDGLLIDADAVAAYLDELVRTPQPPPGDAGAIARGEVVFGAAGCAGCHVPPIFTDGQRHAVANVAAPDGPDALSRVDTPALRGLFLRARLLHDGRSGSLEDLTTRSDLDGHGVKLEASERADVIAYLRSL